MPSASGDADLAAAVAALPAEQREVIALKIDGGLTPSRPESRAVERRRLLEEML